MCIPQPAINAVTSVSFTKPCIRQQTREAYRNLTLVYSCFEKGCLQYEENLNATMSKVIMGNGGFTSRMIEAQGVSACRRKLQKPVYS